MNYCPITGEANCKCIHTDIVPLFKPHLKETLRKLFSDHAFYTKIYITSGLAGLGDAKVIADRLMINQTDIGDTLVPIIGRENGTKLTELLKDHINHAAACVGKLKNKNKAGLKKAVRELYEQGTEVAKFISSLNPIALPFEAVDREFHRHNEHVVTIASLHHARKYVDEYKEMDAYINHMLMFSDFLYSGLI